MIKNMIKTLLISIVIFLGALFVNIDGVKADKACTCNYYLSGDSMQSSYWVDIKYSATEATITKSCEVLYDASNTLCSDGEGKAARGNPFEVDSGYIAENCSKDACATANLKWSKDFWGKVIIVACNDSNRSECDNKADVQAESANGFVAAGPAGGLQTPDNNPTIGSGYQASDIDGIMQWGQTGDINLDGKENIDCNVISGNLKDFLNWLFWILCVIGIVLLIIMTAIEFIKVITGQDDEGIKKALKHSLIRIVCAVLLLLLPMLVNFIITVINNAFSGEVTIGANGEVTCGVGK